MTQVDFHFITPEGDPIQDGFVEITLCESAWLKIESGVVVPRIVFGRTDTEGKISFDLWPVKTAEYTVKVVDTHKDNEVVVKHYFYVPRSDVPVRLQDILMDPPPTPKPYDEASIEAIQENRILAQYAQEQTQGLHDNVVDLEAIVVQHQADVEAKHLQVVDLHGLTSDLHDSTQIALNRTEIAQQDAEQAQRQAEAALSAAIAEALRAEAARTGSETARADAQAFRLQALGFKDQAEAAAATAESIVVTHEAKANPHAQYLLSNDAVATYETLVNATAKLNQALAHTDSHTARIDNPHGVTKDQVGLGLVDNVSAANLRDRGSHTGFQGIDTITGLQAELDNKITVAHANSGDHDDRYYTKTQADDLFTKPRLNNYDGMRDPGAEDDEVDGYERGSSWFNQATGVMWVCTAATTGAAHWMQTSINVNEIGTAAMEDVETLVARANHTGTQTLDTISDAGTAAAANVESFEAAGSVDAHVAEPDPHVQYVQKETGMGLSMESFSSAEKTKLTGIAEGATANQTDAYLLYRANHTGSQPLSTISDAGTAAGADIGDFDASGTADLVLQGHVGEIDPHAQYAMKTELADKANASHDHAGLYLTQAEIEAIIDTKISEYHTANHAV